MRGPEESGTFKLPQHQEAQGLAEEARLGPHTLPARVADWQLCEADENTQSEQAHCIDHTLQKELEVRLRGQQTVAYTSAHGKQQLAENGRSIANEWCLVVLWRGLLLNFEHPDLWRKRSVNMAATDSISIFAEGTFEEQVRAYTAIENERIADSVASRSSSS